MEWLATRGAVIWLPLGHSPDVDLIAEIERRMIRVQVKTSTHRTHTPSGAERWGVQLATNGGNQSWSGLTKKLDPARFDYLFVLVGDGRRWFIPASALDAGRAIRLGGPKYAEFEIDRGSRIERTVYGPGEEASRIGDPARGSAGVGEPGQTVNLVPKLLSGFESLLPHQPDRPPRFVPSKYERTLGKRDQALINQKRRVTLPQRALLDAGLCDGDRVTALADGPGRIVLEKAGLPVWAEAPSHGTPALDGSEAGGPER